MHNGRINQSTERQPAMSEINPDKGATIIKQSAVMEKVKPIARLRFSGGKIWPIKGYIIIPIIAVPVPTKN
jgi:hypothetical protein